MMAITGKKTGISRSLRMKSRILLGMIAGLILCGICTQASEPIKVFVSVAPQAYFVERIAGDKAEVHVMVNPGQDPHTYEPIPRQMAALSKAVIYFRIGITFENAWMQKIQAASPGMKVVDLRQGVPLLEMQCHEQGDHHDHHLPLPDDQAKDPHIWLSPSRVKIMAVTIYNALVENAPSQSDYFNSNLQQFLADLERTDQQIRTMLAPLKNRKFMVYHPAWGYFAADYNLVQIPIETAGKEPSARALTDLIAMAKAEKVKVVFVQKQFSKRSAEVMAREIGGRVVAMDPLEGDYLNNLIHTAGILAEALQ